MLSVALFSCQHFSMVVQSSSSSFNIILLHLSLLYCWKKFVVVAWACFFCACVQQIEKLVIEYRHAYINSTVGGTNTDHANDAQICVHIRHNSTYYTHTDACNVHKFESKRKMCSGYMRRIPNIMSFCLLARHSRKCASSVRKASTRWVVLSTFFSHCFFLSN